MARESLGGEGNALRQKSEDVVAKSLRVVFVNRALDANKFPSGGWCRAASDAVFENAALKEIHFQAAAAEIENQARLQMRSPSAQCTAEQTSRASSSLLITSSSMPVLRRMRSIRRR